jgi:hypothetical protein
MKKRNNLFAGSFTLFLSVALIMGSCKKDHDEVVQPLNDNSLPSAAIANIQLRDKEGKSIRFAIDVVVFRDSKNIENRLGENDFHIDSILSGTIYAFQRQVFNLTSSGSEADYSALMLMDQSGSISGSDSHDYRLEAANTFCSSLGAGNKAMLWSFAGTTYQQYGNGFTDDTTILKPQVDALKNKESGSTPLYKSQVAAIDYCAANAPSSNKALLTFTDGQDNGGGYTPDEVAASGISKNVKLFNIGLSDAETAALCKQAVTSGGAFMYAKDARQLISMFGNLGKLLDKTAQYYHTEWVLTASRDFGTGSLTHELQILLPYGDPILVPFTIEY